MAVASLALASLGGGAALAQDASRWVSPISPSQSILLYPKGQKVDEGIVEGGIAITKGPLEDNGYSSQTVWANDRGGCGEVGDDACMDLYFPSVPNGLAVVVCPGGGYEYVSMFNEGACAADYLVRKGVTVCVVKYRMPDGHYRIPLRDVQNALGYCRHHSAEWKVEKIGVMGFSAGGHLAACASTMFEDDKTRPDFSILMYPVISMVEGITHVGTHEHLLGGSISDLTTEHSSLVEYYSCQNRVSGKTPVTFLALSSDDGLVPPENSLLYYKALIASGVKAQMHIYPAGGHGWGFRREPYGIDTLGRHYREVFEMELDRFLEDVRTSK